MSREGMIFATLTDGRPGRLSQNIYSWIRNASLYSFDEIIIFDNSGNHHQNSTEASFVVDEILSRINHELNIKIIKMGDKTLPLGQGHDFVFQYLYQTNYKYAVFIEDDHFLIDYIPIRKMQHLLDQEDDIAQIAINRNPVYPEEYRDNGVLKNWRIFWGGLQEFENEEINIRYTLRPGQFIFGASMININYLNSHVPKGQKLWEWHFGENIKEKHPGVKLAWLGWIDDSPLACTWLTEDYFGKSFHERRHTD